MNLETSSQALSSVQGVHEGQYCTFMVSGRIYGIEVLRVLEVVRPMDITPIPLAPSYVNGLINLRGQVTTAIDLRTLFGISEPGLMERMSVICRIDGSLIALQVDEIGDVLQADVRRIEETPISVAAEVRRFMAGVYDDAETLISIIDIDRVSRYLCQKNEA